MWNTVLSHGSPHYKKDKQLIEKVQRRFLRLIPEFKSVKYEDALRKLGLNTLEERRNRSHFPIQDV